MSGNGLIVAGIVAMIASALVLIFIGVLGTPRGFEIVVIAFLLGAALVVAGFVAIAREAR